MANPHGDGNPKPEKKSQPGISAASVLRFTGRDMTMLRGIWRWAAAAVLLLALVLALGRPQGGAAEARPAPPVSPHAEASPKVLRIVSLAPSITEILLGLGAMPAGVAAPGALRAMAEPPAQVPPPPTPVIAGRTAFCRMPDGARVPAIGSMGQPAVEQVLALRPDVVLATPLTSPNALEQLREVGLNVVVLNHDGAEGVLADINRIGEAVRRPREAAAMAGNLRRRLEVVHIATGDDLRKGSRRPRVLFLLGLDGLYSAGRGTWPSQLIALAGGANVADTSASAWPQLSMEFVLLSRPEIILITDPTLGLPPAAETPDSTAAARWLAGKREIETELLRTMRRDPIWSELAAVRKGRVVALPASPITVPGPRLADAAELLARVLAAGAGGEAAAPSQQRPR
ncbi:hypothetical protein DB346_09670 [Verrucomicrobia bacterium LW23]|nr:hypothetical protein DB346_09670 [Verrucomicrobia bacterium LW23]